MFFKYITEENKDTKESYPDADTKQAFWDYEVSYITTCSNGCYVYNTIASLMGDYKDTSEFLHDKCGYVGLKVHDKPTHDSPWLTTYVIFSPNDIKILKKNVVNEEIEKYQSGYVANNNAHDIGIGKFGMFKLSPAIMSCIYEAAFQLLGFERFAIEGEMALDNKVMDNPWDDAYHVLKWAIDNKGLDNKYLGRVSSQYSGMNNSQFHSYTKQIESGKRFWFTKEELTEIFKVLPEGLRKELAKDMINVSRIGKIKEVIEYLKNLNGGKNLEDFISIIRKELQNGNIKRGNIANFKEPVKQAMQTSSMIGNK